MLPGRSPNLKHVQNNNSDTLWETPESPSHISRHHRTLKAAVRHHQTPENAIQCQPEHPQNVFFGAWDCLLVSVAVCCCPERWLWAYGWSLCMFMGFGCVLGSFRVFMPCMVQQMLYIGNAWRGKTPRTWHFWNIKIPKPPCISSLKIIGLLHFWKVLGPSEENYNLQSLWITLYRIITLFI